MSGQGGGGGVWTWNQHNYNKNVVVTYSYFMPLPLPPNSHHTSCDVYTYSNVCKILEFVVEPRVVPFVTVAIRSSFAYTVLSGSQRDVVYLG
jgi:hypothetical protein